MFEAMLKSLGIDAADLKLKFAQAFETLKLYDERTRRMELKIDLLLDYTGFDAAKVNEDFKSPPDAQNTQMANLIPPTVSDKGHA
jgi:hypothetical protein